MLILSSYDQEKHHLMIKKSTQNILQDTVAEVLLVAYNTNEQQQRYKSLVSLGLNPKKHSFIKRDRARHNLSYNLSAMSVFEEDASILSCYLCPKHFFHS